MSILKSDIAGYLSVEFSHCGFHRVEHYDIRDTDIEGVNVLMLRNGLQAENALAGRQLSDTLKARGLFPTNILDDQGNVELPAIQDFGAVMDGKWFERRRYYMDHGQLENPSEDVPYYQMVDASSKGPTQAFEISADDSDTYEILAGRMVNENGKKEYLSRTDIHLFNETGSCAKKEAAPVTELRKMVI